MKKDILIIILLSAFLLMSVFSVSALCMNTADDYAAEVLLNKEGISYNLELFKTAKNVIIKDNQYILQSEYNPALALILEKQTFPLSGLSVRLQIPVQSEEKNMPLLKFSSVSPKTLNITGEKNYNGWAISCVNGNPIPQCEFKKAKTNILINLISSKYEIILETREDLSECNPCDGKCFALSEESMCFNKHIESDVEDLLKHIGIVSSINELFYSYKLISLGNVLTTDLSPAAKQDIDWKTALNQELLRLKREGIILITNEDIGQISNLSDAGKAGQNSKIVYGISKSGQQKWLYYYETKFPELTQLENCKEFPVSFVPTGMLTFSGGEISTYYLIPLVLTLILIALLIALIATARFIELNRRKRRIKPITGLQSADNIL